MKTNTTHVRQVLGTLFLTLVLTSCHAQPPAASASAGTAANESAGLDAQYKGTYLFDLIDGSSKRQQPKLAGVPDYATAFRQLTRELSKQDRNFVDRLTSGPSTRGEAVVMDERQAIVHAICQAHACNVARLAVLYRPDDGHMVGLLWDKCELKKLGEPSDQELSVLTKLGRIPEPTAANKNKCEQER